MLLINLYRTTTLQLIKRVLDRNAELDPEKFVQASRDETLCKLKDF